LRNVQKIAIFLIILAACFMVCFFLLLNGIQQEKLKEKFVDIQGYLEILSLHSSEYKTEDALLETLHKGIGYIDRLPHVFAALYDSDLAIMSARSPEEGTAPFDPRKDARCMEAVRNSDGALPIAWEDLEGGITKRTMHTCWRWVDMPGGRFCLMAAGVSSYSLASPSFNVFIGIFVGVLLASLFIFLVHVTLLVRGIA